MRRLPLAAFAALALATVGAFFVTQHLKVSTPLIAGSPRPFPGWISPNQTGCRRFHAFTQFSFYLLHRTDNVAVYVANSDGTIVRTLASGRYMRRGARSYFPWDGRQDGGTLAPDGTYFFRIALLHQGRTIELTKTPVVVRTVPPHPVLTGVTPALIPDRGAPVRIRYRGNQQLAATVQIYRTDLPGPPRLVKQFLTSGRVQTANWDGRIGGRPAPAGTYLVGLQVTDGACNTGRFPAVLPPPPGSTPHAGVSVRYLAAEPPLDPVPAGSATVVYVDSRQHPYSWSLQRAGSRKAVGHGAGHGFALRIRVPRGTAGLYELTLRSGTHGTAVPLVASAAPAPAPRRAPILVVLPSLTWQGEDRVDDDGDGIPNTLDGGGPVQLQRPLLGLPPDLAGEAAFLSFLDRAHLAYDLTTDLGLIDGRGPGLSGHKGVVLPGDERWVPATLGTSLRAYATGGGRVLSIGLDSLLRGVTVTGGRAVRPSAPAGADVFGAHPGALVSHSSDLITVIRDGLGLFSTTSGAFSGFASYRPIASVSSPGQQIVSAAGASSTAPVIVGYRVGRGIVVEIAVAGFGSSLARNVDAQELVSRLWSVLGQ